MIAGNTKNAFLLDMKYNMTDDMLKKITEMKVSAEKTYQTEWEKYRLTGKYDQKKMEVLNYMRKDIDTEILPSIYNKALGHEFQTEFSGKSEASDIITDRVDIASALAKYKGGSILENTIDAAYDEFYSDLVEITEEDKNNEFEAIKRMTQSIENNDEQSDDPEKQLKGLDGYKSFLDWLKKLRSASVMKKKQTKIDKASDIQKVPLMELAKPKILLASKIINRELYCKKLAPEKRYMHIMCDRSGSMNSFRKFRDVAALAIYDDCTAANINTSIEFWNTDIYLSGDFASSKISSRAWLEEKLKNTSSRGDDRMGYCVKRRLEQLTRTKTKQYIICMSDGTGSLDGSSQLDEINKLCIAKNAEVKYVLFSSDNEMYGTKKEDIFYIYG